jgi:hypothetical protein
LPGLIVEFVVSPYRGDDGDQFGQENEFYYHAERPELGNIMGSFSSGVGHGVRSSEQQSGVHHESVN